MLFDRDQANSSNAALTQRCACAQKPCTSWENTPLMILLSESQSCDWTYMPWLDMLQSKWRESFRVQIILWPYLLCSTTTNKEAIWKCLGLMVENDKSWLLVCWGLLNIWIFRASFGGRKSQKCTPKIQWWEYMEGIQEPIGRVPDGQRCSTLINQVVLDYNPISISPCWYKQIIKEMNK